VTGTRGLWRFLIREVAVLARPASKAVYQVLIAVMMG
jgi:hypothetical protein